MALHPAGGAQALEEGLGYRFADPRLLAQALTHRGAGGADNERLEFLGDSVLDCVIAEALYARFPGLREGELHRLKESIVREEALAEAARALGLEPLLQPALGQVRPAALADTVEALFGAVFIEAGYEAARGAILKALGAPLAALDPSHIARDAKSALQEYVQGRFKKLPEYRLVATHGAAHERVFDVECAVPELGLTADGRGASRQKAEQQAAANMLEKLP